MPRGRSKKGSVGRTTFGEPAKEDTVVEIDLDSGSTNVDSSSMNLDNSSMNLDTSIVNVGACENDESQNKCTHVEHVDEEISSPKAEITTQVLECSDEGEENKIDTKEKSVIHHDNNSESEVIDQDNNSESEVIDQDNNSELRLETMDTINHILEQSNSAIIHQEGGGNCEANVVVDNKLDSLVTEQGKEKQLETLQGPNNLEEKDAELCAVEDQKKDDELQNIDQKSNEKHNLLDATESGCKNEGDQHQKMTDQTDNSVGTDIINNTVVVDISDYQDVDEVENSKFEEISEGSIEQAEQDDIIAESLSDVEITGESFDPEKVQNNRNNPIVKGKNKVIYKKSQILGAAYSAAKEDKVKSAVENKDNDDISDASLSDHVDLSLEEISDDELELSKKKRKLLGQTPVKSGSNVKTSGTAKQDKDNTGSAVDVFEKVQQEGASAKAQKHAASEKVGATNPISSKRMKLDENNDIEEVSSKDEQVLTFSTTKRVDLKKETDRYETKGLDFSYNRNVVISSWNPSESSTNWRQRNTERPFESRNSSTFNRKYKMVDSSCQSEPLLLKGKIIQCNINPVTPTHELDRQEKSDESAVKMLELLSKFKHRLQPSIPDTIISDVCSLQPSHRKGIYSISMGPLRLLDTQSSTFKDILSDTENFSLVFADQCHGVFKATFVKCENIASLFTWLNHQELKSRDLVVSVLYSGENSVWKAVLLHVENTSVKAEKQIVSVGEQNGVQVYLHGTPSDVSTDFIHLLFPEAQNVVTDHRTSKGIVTLNYSDSKMTEAVLSFCSLLVINGSQINISCVRSLEDKQNMDICTEATDKSEASVKKGTEHEQFSRCGKISGDDDQGADHSGQKQEHKAHSDLTNKFESDRTQQKPAPSVADEESDERGKSIGSSTEWDVKDVGSVLSNVESDAPMISGTDSSLPLADNTKETNAGENVALLQAKCKFAERTNLTKEEAENIVVNLAVHENKPVKLKNRSEETEGEVTQLDSAHNFAEFETVIGKDKPCNLVVAKDNDKLNASVQDKAKSDNESQPNKDTITLDSDAEISLLKVNCVIPEASISDKATEGGNYNGATGEVEAGNEILEDVSDGEKINQKKHEATVVEDAPKEPITHAGDCVEVSGTDILGDSAGKGGNKSGADRAGHSESINSTLVMTDGALEVRMEVIDVNDGDDEVEKVILSRYKSQDTDVYHSSYPTKPGMHARQLDTYKTGSDMSGSSRHRYTPSWKKSPSREFVGEPAAHRRDSFSPQYRSRSRSPRRDWHGHSHGYRRHESQQSDERGNSRKTEFYSKEENLVSRSEYSSHRDPRYLDRRHSYKEHKPLYSSRRSKSPESYELDLQKTTYRRESPKSPVLHTSRSPISISSRSHSLSPVSKSSSLDLPQTGVGKDELAKTVEHFLKLAKDLHQTKNRRSFRPRGSHRSSSRYSPHVSRSSYTKQSKSPQPALSRSSRSPTYTRSSRYRYKRSPSPASYRDNKRHYEDRKGDPYTRESGGSRNYEKPTKSSDYSYTEQSGRSKPKWPVEPHRAPNDHLGQQSFGGYQPPSCGPVPASNIYSPSFPPPGMYPSSSVPVYQYNSQSQYSYSNVPPGVPPTYMPNVPPPQPPHSFNQPYQPAYPMYPPRF